jgi:hypothetical protein
MMRANDSQSVERYVATVNLAAVLAVQGRKQAWLAERLGVSSSLLCLIIGGAKTVDCARGQQIADALGVPFRMLFKLRKRSDSDADASLQPAPVTIGSDPIKPRLVVHHGDHQRILRPASGLRHGRGPETDDGGRSPPG